MLRSLYSAVSSVKAHQTYLDVTGNNIANVNTVGFKKDVVNFRDMIYQTVKNPSQPDSSVPIGGVNPAQVGLGVSVGSIETVHTQGSMQGTGIPTDMAIQGSGYFVVNNGTQRLYTRAGNFSLDTDGNLVMQGNGYMVQGYAYNSVIDPATGILTRQKDPNLTSLNIPIGEKIPAKATQIAAFRCNLCSTAEADIPDTTSIPGGDAATLRPNTYEAYGGKEVTYVGDTEARKATIGAVGDTFFDVETDKIYTWSKSGETAWVDGGTPVDGYGPDTPTKPGVDGETFFNTTDYKLYTFTTGHWGTTSETSVAPVDSGVAQEFIDAPKPIAWNNSNVFFNTNDNTLYHFEWNTKSTGGAFVKGVDAYYGSGTTLPLTDDPTLTDGAIFYRTSDNTIHTFNKSTLTWQSGIIALDEGTALPTPLPTEGTKYYSMDENKIYEFHITESWPTRDLNVKASFAKAPPLTYNVGDLFYNTSNNKIYKYIDGTASYPNYWEEDASKLIGVGTTAEMQTAAATANAGELYIVRNASTTQPDVVYRMNGSGTYTQLGRLSLSGSKEPEIPTDGYRYFNTTNNYIWEFDGNTNTWNRIEKVDSNGEYENPFDDPQVMAAISASSTSELNDGYKYFNTDNNLIYTYTLTGGWTVVDTLAGEGVNMAALGTLMDDGTAKHGERYLNMDDKKIYTMVDNIWRGTGTGVSGHGASDPATGLSGDKFFNTDTKTIKTFTTTETWGDATDKAGETYYYGSNTAASGAGVFGRVYSDGDMASPGAVVTGRETVDAAMSLPAGSTEPSRMPAKAGERFLDIDTGIIYTANSTGTGWITSTPPERMQSGIAYATKGSGTIYLLDGQTSNPTVVSLIRGRVLDQTNGNKNVFYFDGTTWRSINDTQNSATALSPSTQSVTTQEHLTEYGKSIIAAHDWEDKFTVYDSRGDAHTMIVVFRKVMDRPAEPNATPPTGAEAEWDWYAYYADSDGTVLSQYGQGAGTMVFGDDGLLKRTYYYEPTPATPDPNGTNAPTAPEYTWKSVEKIIGDPAYESVATGKVVADFNLSGAQGSVVNGVYSSNMITLDFLGSDYAKTLGLTSEPIDGVTNYGSSSTTIMKAQDGYEMGVLNDWTISAGGVITGAYSNGRNLEIAQVALAMFANPQGLSQVGETCFAETINSGIAQVGSAQTNGAGSIQGNTVEMSNVDLSEEFVNLIRAQRGFQASTRVVTTSDEVLQELINLKR